MDTHRIARIAMIAAVYAGATLVAMLFLGWMAWGPIQFRIWEAFTVLALFCCLGMPLYNALAASPLVSLLSLDTVGTSAEEVHS